MSADFIKPFIVGLSGTEVSVQEKAFIQEHRPYGFILFARNCASTAQVSALCAALRDIIGEERLPILIDQEGGRVARLKPPHWQVSPAAGVYADIAAYDMARAKRLTYLGARRIAAQLTALGITVDCAPVADIPSPGSHDIIGDRAYGDEPGQVCILAREMAEGLLDGGVLPVLKHIPGHGRATADSHAELPSVDTPLEELERTDFVPFWDLADLPFAMTAHIRYAALDAELPATLSAKAIQYIREVIGFTGVLMSDDISMKALSGDIGELARASLAAGCELVLHCNGEMTEMQTVASALSPVEGVAKERLSAVWDALPLYREEDSVEEIEEEYAALFNEATGDKIAAVG